LSLPSVHDLSNSKHWINNGMKIWILNKKAYIAGSSTDIASRPPTTTIPLSPFRTGVDAIIIATSLISLSWLTNQQKKQQEIEWKRHT
jgi:hypothetical protein